MILSNADELKRIPTHSDSKECQCPLDNLFHQNFTARKFFAHGLEITFFLLFNLRHHDVYAILDVSAEWL